MKIDEIRQGLAEMLLGLGNVQKDFTRKTYPGRFEAYLEEHRDFLSEVNADYLEAEDPVAFLNEIGDACARAAAEEIQKLPKRKRELLQMEYNLAMVTFVDPAILEMKGEISEPLTNRIVEAWGEVFPERKIQIASYEEISSGFRKRWCYITTAVCQHLNKGDDCEELCILRNYRDTYLEMLPEGHELVHRYYDLAPTVVNRIDRREDSAEIYEAIYHDYLVPCIHDIEDGAFESCRERYENMVYDLYKQFVTA